MPPQLMNGLRSPRPSFRSLPACASPLPPPLSLPPPSPSGHYQPAPPPTLLLLPRISPLQVITSLRNHSDKVRIVLNKSDSIDQQQLMRVYGALMWSLGKVFKSPEVRGGGAAHGECEPGL